MLTLSLLLSSLISTSFATPAAETDCFSTHVKDAIQVNRARKPLYAKASSGRSRAASDILIASEMATLPIARYMDKKARPYQEKGIALLCDEFISMKMASGYTTSITPTGPAPRVLIRKFGRTTVKTITAAAEKDGFAGIARAGEEALTEISKHPSYLCMTRHILESIVRAANLAPIHRDRALAAGLEDPSDISEGFIRQQLFALNTVRTLEIASARAQEKGTPIICQDVPPIPLR